MSQEDKIVNQMIPWFESLEPEYGDNSTEIDIEVPYNDYGDKGVVDLFVSSEIQMANDQQKWARSYRAPVTAGGLIISKVVRVIEIKSEYALAQVTGANEILRQFKKHGKHFFADEQQSHRPYRSSGSYQPPGNTEFWLVFEDTDKTRRHLNDNYYMYDRVGGDGTYGMEVFVWDTEREYMSTLEDVKDD